MGARSRQGEPDLFLSWRRGGHGRKPRPLSFTPTPRPAFLFQIQSGLEGLPNQRDKKRFLLPTRGRGGESRPVLSV